MAQRAPGVHTHEEWKGMAQPVGLVVEPVVLNRLGIFPESATTVLADWQQRLEQLLEDQPVGEQWLSVAPSFELFCQEVLAWQDGDLRKPEELPAPVAVHLDDYDEVLRPDWFVHEPSQGDGALKAQLLVQELPLGAPFDALPKGLDGRRQWEATPQQRLERLLKESEHPIGLLWNGVALRMVYAPRGESSGHLTFPLEPMTTVDGRPMLAALQMLLGPDRLFEGGASNTRLRPLMEQSRKEQNEVSTRLAEQVLEALWILLRGFDAAGLEANDPSHIYGGLITVLLRLVFLLYAEDEELMPSDSLYGQHYSVGGLALRLRQDRADYQNAMEGRRGAWATLLSLFRLVYDGGGSSEAYLPARHGDLFDPDAYPFLEGRTAGTSYTDGPLASVPAISDDVVEQVLTKLLLLDGQILSYRALDVEQIGSVYEGIMGFMVEKATGPSVGITHKPPRQKITITVVVNAEELLAQPPGKRDAWLKEVTGVDLKLPSKASKGLKAGTSVEDLCDALDKRLSKHTPRGGFLVGSLILQPTAERRRSGSHYTPRALTEPIVAEALRPWLERCQHHPTAEQILALKVCDPAMGSGAFLVAVCRFLAEWLVKAWERDGYPDDFRAEWDKDMVARRLVAQRCLYGVDKNPFAVSLAKLSLWLVTLSQDLPFTFVDHALKCGDSLVGYSVAEIQSSMKEVQLSFLDQQNRVYEQMGLDRRESFAEDNLDDKAYDRKRILLERQIEASEGLRQAGDLMVAAFFAASKPKDRATKQEVYLAMLSGAFKDDGLAESVQEVREWLSEGDKGITPFHWDLEFPEVFSSDGAGFDAFVGNPPFAGHVTLSSSNREGYTEWLRQRFPGIQGKCDLIAGFVRITSLLLDCEGALGLLCTTTVRQGDTRDSGLAAAIEQGLHIYNARRRFAWPGIAAVSVCSIHLKKGSALKERRLNGKRVDLITAYLLTQGDNRKPPVLAASTGYSYQGTVIRGTGFLFDDAKGGATPVSIARELLAEKPHYSSAIKEFIGGEDLLGSTNGRSSRFAIDLGECNKNEIHAFPELLEIVERKVKTARESSKAKTSSGKVLSEWWKFSHRAENMYRAIRNKTRVIAAPQTSTYHTFAFVPTNAILAQTLVVIDSDSLALIGLLSSRAHEAWSLTHCSTLEDRPRYIPTDAFETFPFPFDLDTYPEELMNESSVFGDLEDAAKGFISHREQAMGKESITLSDYHNRLNSPMHNDAISLAARDLMDRLDQCVFQLYGWSDLPVNSYFTLDVCDLDLDCDSTEVEQAAEGQGEIRYASTADAAGFESRLRLETGYKKRIPWRYRWEESIRDEVVSRLLVLNGEHSSRDAAMEIHDKKAKKDVMSNARQQGRREPSVNLELTSEPYQPGLKLF